MIAPIEQKEHARRIRQSLSHQYEEPYETDASGSSHLIRRSRETIAEHPVAAIAIAAVVGLSAAWLIKRSRYFRG